jgi:hypothetical protein
VSKFLRQPNPSLLGFGRFKSLPDAGKPAAGWKGFRAGLQSERPMDVRVRSAAACAEWRQIRW